MTPNSSDRVFEIFDAAVDLSPAERSAFLDDACGADTDLRAAVESMLIADREAHPLLDESPTSLRDALVDPRASSVEGQQVGPYRLVRELGRGGMGAVYLAVRDDVGKQVALKLVRGALAAPDHVERFHAERRILARMEHPNIANLLDAGVTADGTPWFAMERVTGGPVTAEADRRRLPIRERLRLFEQVCEAVAYAHRHRVVHRDLKPSNTLVDDEGRVKLLDFGIAKLLGDESPGNDLTRTGARPMTPEYAAPEQVRGEAVTPATDVYTLGAVLYELLTGHRPQRMRGGSFAEAERAVLQTDPPLPSAAVARTEEVAHPDGRLERIDPGSVATARATDRVRLRRKLAGDLDAIVMRAMAKEPERRYPSAEELLADLRAYSRGLPVSARPYSRRYRLRRFVTRHRSGAMVAATLTMLVALASFDQVGVRVGSGPGSSYRVVPGRLTSLFTTGGAGSADVARTLAVFPFSFHGSPAWGYLGEGMVMLLSTQLDGAGGTVRAVDSRALYSLVAQSGSAPTDPRSARQAAVQLGAGAYVLGQIVEVSGTLRITATLYDAGRPDGGRINEVTVEGEGSDILGLVDELGTRLLARSMFPGQLGSIASHTTSSPAALLAFLEGERELRAGRYTQAMDAFRHATDADSTFALAYYGLSRAAHWTGRAVVETSGAVMAIRYADRLTRQDRLLIQAWDHYRNGAVGPADSLYRVLLDERPDDIEAWLQLGEIGFHYGTMLGRPAADSREAFERVLAYEPDNVGALIHLARIVAQAGEYARLDSLARRIEMLEPDGELTFGIAVLQAFVHGAPQLPDRLRRRLEAMEHYPMRQLLQTTAAHSGNFAGSTALAREIEALLWVPGARPWATTMVAQLELARGRWSAARAALDTLASSVPDWDGEFRAALLTFPFIEVPEPEIRAARDALARAKLTSSTLTPPAFDQRRHYLMALLSMRLGDDAALNDQLRRLERYDGAGSAGDSTFSRRFIRDLRARIAVRDDRPEEALDLIGPPSPQPDDRRPELSSYYMANERWLRAELLHRLGRDAEALRIYASFPDPDAYDLIYVAPSHLRQAQIHDRRGDDRQAAEHYARFVELWRDADPELQATVGEALARLVALGSS